MQNKTNTVKCGVTDCAYYNNSYCTAQQINIGGQNADKADCTRCETFSPSGRMVNACNTCSVGGNTTIHCDAEKCTHNQDKHCMLSGIDVTCSCSGCNCSESDQTYCASFKN